MKPRRFFFKIFSPLTWAFILALTGIGLSTVWYFTGEKKFTPKIKTDYLALAQITKIKNEVQKKLIQEIIWKNLKSGDPFYFNEVIRTSENSEVELVLKNGTQIDLDPDSALRIWEVNGEVNIDFIQGHIFFRAFSSKSADVILNSGSAKVLLRNCEATFDSFNSGRALEIQVYRGNLEINQRRTKVILDRDKTGIVSEKGVEVRNLSMLVKSPGPYSAVFVHDSKIEPVIFEWQPIPESYNVYLEIGETRMKMERMFPPVPGKSGYIAMKLALGNYYWRLVAVGGKNQMFWSGIEKFTVKDETPPLLISPVGDMLAIPSPQTGLLDLRWANPSHLENLHVEVARDYQFLSDVYSEAIQDTGIHEAPLTEDGIYFWRVSGFRSGTTKEVTSQIQRFVLRTRFPLIPPILREPSARSILSLSKVLSDGLYLSWFPVTGIDRYAVKVIDQKGAIYFEGFVDQLTQIKVNLTRPGIYRWEVFSMNADEESSRPAEAAFEVR